MNASAWPLHVLIHTLAGFTPIHLFTLLTRVLLPVAAQRARRHERAGHARAMTGLLRGALVIAGLFALAPGRRLGTLPWSALGSTG
jgi:uncharacterized membrane protein